MAKESTQAKWEEQKGQSELGELTMRLDRKTEDETLRRRGAFMIILDSLG